MHSVAKYLRTTLRYECLVETPESRYRLFTVIQLGGVSTVAGNAAESLD